MKIKQWIGAYVLILATACSNQVFTPSEEFIELDRSNSISPEELLKIASYEQNIVEHEGLRVLAYNATSDKAIAKDVSKQPVEVPIEEFGGKIHIMSKLAHDGKNYILIKTETEKHLWIAF